jgi:hypothetical protein
MAKHSNHVPYDSPDGLPTNPYPMVPVIQACTNEDCGEDVHTEICPFCGAENEIDYEPDYSAGEREHEDD